MAKPLQFRVWLEDPSSFDTLETWLDFQKQVNALPDDEMWKAMHLDTCTRVIARKRKNGEVA